MGTGMRTLVAVTCVVIIAVAGYWFWNDQSDRQAARERAAYIAVVSRCRDALEELNLLTGPLYEEVKRCVAEGNLTSADVEDRVRRR